MIRIALFLLLSLSTSLLSAQDMQVIHDLNIHCDAWNKGEYYGDVMADVPNGYGLLRFPDSSFYSGQFKDGKVTGLGFLRKASQHKIIVGKWFEGQLINDWFTAMDNTPTLYLKRAIDGKYYGRGLGSFDGNTLQYVEAQDTSSSHPHQYIFTLGGRDGSLWYVQDYDAEGNSNSDMHSISSWEDEWKLYHMSHGKILSREQGRPLVYLEKIKALWDEFEPGLPPLLRGLEHVQNRGKGFGSYYGRAFDNTPENGSLGFEFNDHANQILVSRYKNDLPVSFIRQLINYEGEQRYYFGNFEVSYDNGQYHTGDGLQVIYGKDKSVTVIAGNLVRNGNDQTWVNSMSLQMAPDRSMTIRFKNHPVDGLEYGYIILPNEMYIYKGELDEEGLPNGMGISMAEETRIQASGRYKHNEIETKMPVPPMRLLKVTALFDKPFDLSLE
jgi:hypothetical protein